MFLSSEARNWESYGLQNDTRKLWRWYFYYIFFFFNNIYLFYVFYTSCILIPLIAHPFAFALHLGPAQIKQN